MKGGEIVIYTSWLTRFLRPTGLKADQYKLTIESCVPSIYSLSNEYPLGYGDPLDRIDVDDPIVLPFPDPKTGRITSALYSATIENKCGVGNQDFAEVVFIHNNRKYKMNWPDSDIPDDDGASSTEVNEAMLDLALKLIEIVFIGLFAGLVVVSVSNRLDRRRTALVRKRDVLFLIAGHRHKLTSGSHGNMDPLMSALNEAFVVFSRDDEVLNRT